MKKAMGCLRTLTNSIMKTDQTWKPSEWKRYVAVRAERTSVGAESKRFSQT